MRPCEVAQNRYCLFVTVFASIDEWNESLGVSDSFHSSMLANTVTNRQYLFCATSQGRIFPSDAGHAPWTCPTIFSSLQNAGVNWKYYYSSGIFLAGFADWSN